MIEAYRTAFERFAADGGAAPAWLKPVREAAMDRFAATGFPGSKDEEWRFTPVAPIARTPFAVAEAPASPTTQADIARFAFGHPEWTTLVLVNGRFAPELSVRPTLPGGAVASGLAEAMAAGHPALEAHLTRHAGAEATPFTALNTALAPDGAFVHVPRGVELTEPIHLLSVMSADAGFAAYPRHLIVIEEAARASVVESYVTLRDAAYLTNVVTEVSIGAGAWMEHTRIQRESEQAYHVGFSQVDQEGESHYRSFTFALGAAMSRHNLHARLNAPRVETLLYGLYLTHGDQVADNHTAIHHLHPNCNSWEVYKGILDERSRAVFNGKVFVTPEAQQTDAKQTNRNLLLSDEARVDTKPQLEIFADDVKCTHGATVGALDELPVFYARSRGLPEAEARLLLTYAFAAEVLEEVAVAPVREELEELVNARLLRLGAGA